MTDDPRAPRPPRSPDELASALLDGDLPPAEAESARRDPAVAARVAELAAARARLRDVPPPPPGTIDTAIAAALAAYDEDTPGATVTPLRPHPAQPEPWTPATPAGAGPAASRGTRPGQPAHPGQAPDSGQTPSPSPAPWAAKSTGEPAQPPGPSPAGQPPGRTDAPGGARGPGEPAHIPHGTSPPATWPPRRRSGRSRSKAPRRVPAWLGAAALVAVLAGVVGLAALGSRHQDADQSTAASGDSAEDSGAGSAQAAPNSSGGESLSSAPAPTAPGGELGDIGDYPTADALADRVLALVPPAALDQLAPEAATGGDADSSRIAPANCGDIPATVSGVDAVRVHGTARLDGAPVDVWLVTTGGKDRLVVVDATCAVVADRPLG